MKYSNDTHKAEIIGDAPETIGGFQIKIDGKAFEALTSNLYTNSIGAMIRELATNAKDAHVDAGNADKPFDIHLPTELEPYYFVRDYGKGLSLEDMKNVYTVLFESTKDTSNEATGCFGLGAKTPFSYNTRSFIVTSYQNGLERTYTAFFGEDGIPDLTMDSERPTDEADGLKVYVTARKEDINAFYANAQVYLPYFNAPHANVLNPSFEFEEEDVFLEGNGWRILSHSPQAKSYILMGGVPYPIELWNVKVDDKQQKKIDEVKTLLENLHDKYFKVELSVPLGDVKPQLSREELYYSDANTCKNIIKHAINFKKDLLSKILSSLDDAVEYDSYLKACMEYTNLAERKFSFLSDKSISNPQWKGDIPKAHDNLFNGWLLLSILNFGEDSGIEFKECTWAYSRRSYKTKTEITNKLDIRNLFNSDVHIAIQKGCTGYQRRIKNYVSEQRNKVLLFTDAEFKAFSELVGLEDGMLNKIDPTNYSNNGYELGKVNYIDCNDLPKPMRNYSSDYVPKEGRVNKDNVRANLICSIDEDGNYKTHSRGGEDILIESDSDATIVYCHYFDGCYCFVNSNVDNTKYANVYSDRIISNILSSGIGIEGPIEFIAIKGKQDCASLRKAAKFGWTPMEKFIQDWIDNNQETIENCSKVMAFQSVYDIDSEFIDMHPMVNEYHDKYLELQKEVEAIEGYAKGLPYFHNYEVEEYEELKAEYKALLETDYSKWKGVYCNIRWNSSFNELWDAYKFKIQMTYDENLQPIDITKMISKAEIIEDEEPLEETA